MYPARQVQSATSSLPPDEFVPGGHMVHVPVPVLVLYVPAPHSAHATPFKSAVYPASQMQSPTEPLPGPELVPGGQVVHTPVPVPFVYVPATHPAHATPLESAVYPAEHKQFATSELPIHDSVLAGHSKHPPVPLLYVPAPQTVHCQFGFRQMPVKSACPFAQTYHLLLSALYRSAPPGGFTVWFGV